MSEETKDLNNEIININELIEKTNDVKNSVVRLIIGNDIGSGFFCKIYINNNPMPALITCYHIINSDYIENTPFIYFTYFSNGEKYEGVINLDIERIIAHNEDLDITMIEIKEEDNLDIYSFLEMDNSINVYNPQILYKKVYLFHYPKGIEKVQFSQGKISNLLNNKNFLIDYSTEPGSSGSPIIDYDTNLVIGMHKGIYNSMFNNNKREGILLKYAIEELIKEKTKEIENSYVNLYPYSNTMDLIYNIPKNNSIQLFSSQFVDHHKGLCKLIYNEETYPLMQHFLLKKISKEDLEKGVIKITLTNFDNIKDMYFMFSRCKELKKVIATGTDFSKIITMEAAFEWCESLEELSNTSKWNVENVKSFKGLFYMCKNLKKVPGIRKWKPYNLENYDEMFLGCQSQLDLSETDVIKDWKNISKKTIKGDYMKGFGVKNIISYALFENWKGTAEYIENNFDNIIQKINDFK